MDAIDSSLKLWGKPTLEWSQFYKKSNSVTVGTRIPSNIIQQLEQVSPETHINIAYVI